MRCFFSIILFIGLLFLLPLIPFFQNYVPSFMLHSSVGILGGICASAGFFLLLCSLIYPTELRLAFSYLRPKRSAVSVITLISVLGVSLGVMVLIVVLAVMSGFTDLWKEKMLATTPHVKVIQRPISYNSSTNVYGIRNSKDILKQMQDCMPGLDPVRVVESPTLLQTGDFFDAKMLLGVEEKQNRLLNEISQKIKFGEARLGNRRILVSTRVARQFNLGIGSKIFVHSPTRLAKLAEVDKNGKMKLAENAEIALPVEYEVSGIFSFDFFEFDKQMIFIGMDDADELLGLPWETPTSIYGWVEDPFTMRPSLKNLERSLGFDQEVLSWEDLNRAMLNVLQMEKTMMFFLLIFIVLVAAFCIMNTIITVVMQKTREIGLLKALGASDGNIMRVFVFQGMIVGLAGNFLGQILGVLVVTFRNDILKLGNWITNRDLFPAEFYYFGELPGKIEVSDLLFISIVSVVLCMLGAIIPAISAALLDPAKAIRNE